MASRRITVWRILVGQKQMLCLLWLYVVGLQNRHEADVTNSFQILPNTFKEICEAAVRAKKLECFVLVFGGHTDTMEKAETVQLCWNSWSCVYLCWPLTPWLSHMNNIFFSQFCSKSPGRLAHDDRSSFFLLKINVLYWNLWFH